MLTLTRRSRSMIAAVCLMTAVALTVPLAAQAHNVLAASNPAADSTISTVPESFSITTNESLLDLSGDGNGFAIQVLDPAGLYYGDGCTVVADATLAMGATLGEAGVYRFLWQAVSADGHTISGEFAFTWAPAADAVISPGSPTPPVCGVPVEVPEETPTATPTLEQTEEPTAEPIETEMTTASDPMIGLWIGGGVVAILVAVAVVVLVRRRRA